MQKFSRISRDDFAKNIKTVREVQSGLTDNIIDNNISRKDIVNIYDKAFYNKVMLLFENNDDVNSLFIDTFDDKTEVNWIDTFGVAHDPLNSCLRVEDGSYVSEIYSRDIFTQNNTSSKMNNFYLTVDAQVSHDDSILYYIETDKGDLFPIVHNSKVAFIIKNESQVPYRVRLKCVINRHLHSRHIPFLNGIALMYEDAYTKSQIDIFNHNFQLNTDEDDDMLVLFRDPKRDDILYKVENFKEKVDLIYDDDGRLALVDVSDLQSGGLSERVELIYEDYLNSKYEVENVLTKVKTRKASKIEEF